MKVRSRFSSIPTKRSSAKFAPKRAREQWNGARVLRELRALGEQRNVDGMGRFGIRAKVVYGVAKPKMDELAHRIGKDHDLSLELWATGVHDARILAGMIDEPSRVTAAQMERWVRHFDNWDVCDGTCCHLFVFAAPAWSKAVECSRRKKEFEKRAGFALMAYLAYRDKSAPDAKYRRVFSLIHPEGRGERDFLDKTGNEGVGRVGE